MGTKEMFQPHLVDLQMSVETEEELFEQIADRLKRQGYVNEGYLEGIKNREKRFPTGLMTEYLNIALPHSDTEYIEKPFIYVARIEKPVMVRQMGDNQEMAVKDFFFLGIKEPAKQVGLLQELMTMFQKDEFVARLKQAKQNQEMFDLFMEQLT
ncbi:PTS sugar transporter subunit IIA [Enterococcus rivorum]|uniref:PTS sugar transporter subunit IIA n=1 Tax=Enterococcus rivorum TaxID=762845 RepID=A0A1E5KWP0_9ENTE|nr:PTS sugar transporter subunit IIA [Enterococcus rivorum]MBP2099127.1 PTS system galactitol-specific IIA component [Enterococcus rivorum]OEH82277.1 PTS sugar transporter subunit IIA [Enterococcus rivorum]